MPKTCAISSVRRVAIAIALGFLSITSGCSKSESTPQREVRAPAKESPSIQPPAKKPLHPLFLAALDCFKTCVGHPKNLDNPDTPILLPRNFPDFLDENDYGRKSLMFMVSKWPEVSVNQLREGAPITTDGAIGYVMDFEGDAIQIYTQVSFYVRVGEKPAPGLMGVAVNSRTRAMAVLFNGKEDLSEYRFAGDEKLQAVLLAYKAVREAETEKAYRVSQIKKADEVRFPVPSNRVPDAEARLNYLNGLFVDGAIEKARSAYSSGDESRKISPEKQWWSVNSTFTHCFETGGPAVKLDEFIGFTDKPYSKDFRDTSGKIVKVEVVNSAGSGQETVWTYYKDKARCESEQVNSTKNLADKYR